MRQNLPAAFGGLVGRMNTFYSWVTVVALVLIMPLVVAVSRRRGPLYPAVVLFVVLCYVANCFINAGMVVVAQRFGAKLIWMIPMLVLIGVVSWLTTDRVPPTPAASAGANGPMGG
jgi:hypothetical protein